ncbi:MAG TPA: DUF3099 domain-containing protein [Acidothermaceae bacterium]|nr:DUF3099 domain-containing protein [Acidothermaceae bacterium]
MLALGGTIIAAYGRGVERRVRDRAQEDDSPVYLVTAAQPGHSQEMSGRLRRYLISMTVRVVFLVLAIFLFTGWLRVVGIAAAVVLPWIAVVMANAGPVGDGAQPEFVSTDRIGIDGPAVTQLGHSTEVGQSTEGPYTKEQKS